MANTGFFGPRSRDHARLLLDAAAKIGVDQHLVKTTRGGYLVPQEVLDYINSLPAEGEYVGPLDDKADDAPSEEPKAEPTEPGLDRPNVNESKALWLAYAQSVGLDVTDETSKADIIEAVKAAEKDTEEQK